MNDHPLISAIIPAFNCGKYLGAAIESVLAQSYSAVELIVVDDGSTDSSARIARSFPEVRVFCRPNRGVAAARNTGVCLAQGEYLAFLDCDDLWLPEKLDLQMAVFRSEPTVEMVFGNVEQFISLELDEAARARIRIPRRLMPGYHAGTLLISQAAFQRVGYFDVSWRRGEFVEWYTRAVDFGLRGTMLSAVLMRRRIHETNATRQGRATQNEYARVLRLCLKRRRTLGD